MSSSLPSSSSPTPSEPAQQPPRSRALPRGVLSNREEDQLLKATKARGIKECGEFVKAFADCATGRTVTVVWACREQHKAVQRCLLQYTGPEAMDEARQEWLRTHR